MFARAANIGGWLVRAGQALGLVSGNHGLIGMLIHFSLLVIYLWTVTLWLQYVPRFCRQWTVIRMYYGPIVVARYQTGILE